MIAPSPGRCNRDWETNPATPLSLQHEGRKPLGLRPSRVSTDYSSRLYVPAKKFSAANNSVTRWPDVKTMRRPSG